MCITHTVTPIFQSLHTHTHRGSAYSGEPIDSKKKSWSIWSCRSGHNGEEANHSFKFTKYCHSKALKVYQNIDAFLKCTPKRLHRTVFIVHQKIAKRAVRFLAASSCLLIQHRCSSIFDLSLSLKFRLQTTRANWQAVKIIQYFY